MTRLTNPMRDTIIQKIMADVPNVNYAQQIYTLAQRIIVNNMDPKVRAVYDDPDLRKLLGRNYFEVRKGNSHVYGHNVDEYVYGLRERLSLQIDDPMASMDKFKDTLWGKLVNELRDSGLVDKYFEQRDLYDKVKKRVRNNVYSVGTIKRLYDVLEPELHMYIPKGVNSVYLPATVTPVVDDLRKLGKQLPDVPKAVKAEA